MEINEIIFMGIALGIVVLVAIYESIMHKMMRNRLHEARERASSWKSLYRTVSEERDLLMHRLQSRDCQKVICYQTELERAQDEIERLTKLNETYKRQIESGKKRKAASGTANTESCK